MVEECSQFSRWTCDPYSVFASSRSKKWHRRTNSWDKTGKFLMTASCINKGMAKKSGSENYAKNEHLTQISAGWNVRFPDTHSASARFRLCLRFPNSARHNLSFSRSVLCGRVPARMSASYSCLVLTADYLVLHGGRRPPQSNHVAH
jgi:hypothetical protein